MVGKRETFLKLPYLQNDVRQNGGNTNVCLRFFLVVITNGWIGQVKFSMELNCINFKQYMQNNTSYKLLKHEAI